MFEATIGIPFQAALLFRNRYSRWRLILARLGASERLGRISTSSKSSFGSLSMRMTGQLPYGGWVPKGRRSFYQFLLVGGASQPGSFSVRPRTSRLVVFHAYR